MDQGKRKLAAAVLAAASLTAAATTSALGAGTIYPETGDAGQTLATAQATGPVSGVPLAEITGSFSGASDADLYAFTLTSPSTFSASTNNTVTNVGGQDTALFLFNASGVAVATNDDAAGGTTTDSTLPVGNAFYANLAAGTYYIGISESGDEAINTASQLLFTGYPGGDTTAVRGAASGVNPTTLSTFNGNEFAGGGAGAYEIDLTGAATFAIPVPEPSTWALLGLGSIAAASAFLRRRRAV